MAELDLIDDFFGLDAAGARDAQIRKAGEIGATFVDDAGATHSYASLAPVALAAHEQLAFDLPGYDERDAIRKALASKLEREVVPHAQEDWLAKYPERLRLARQRAHWGIRVKDGKLIAYWDRKAGLSRLCPDDAREEAMRLRRRMLPARDSLRKQHRFLYAVFTMPNSAPGNLRAGMQAIFRRFRNLLRSKDSDGELRFPHLKGAVAVLEAPLGEHRDWNIHLNVIIPCTRKAFIDWAELRAAWHWQVHMRWISEAPGAFESAFAELIKYAVATTVAKSAEHAASGKSRAPPMLEWSPAELVEWLRAMHGFRRTRTYGVLYKLEKPEPEEQGPIIFLGTVSMVGGRYVHRCSLLDSIPEDKSLGLSASERWLALIRALMPAGVAGAGELGSRVPLLREVS
jgi:hypothetical protein